MEHALDKKKVFRAELHVHTPSSNCYKGPKTDNEYLRIIETAAERGISILAITDHNSIRGFSRIQSLRQKTINEYNALVSLSDSIEAKAKAKQLKKTLDAFGTLLLIPGVEFEVNNGIHLLVLFNPNTPESTIERFLIEGGYEEKSFGKENDVFSSWSIFDLYKESREYDCIVLDAHSDSNKGIYNTLTGQPRVHAFTDSSLVGICYKSERQKNCIESIISQYSRPSPVAFLKSSDAHQLSEIGHDISFFRIDENNWEAIKEAFDNPTECIFTTYPETHSIINKVAKSESCLFIGQLDDNTHSTLSQFICGLANANGGFIVLGADGISAVNGISEEREDELVALIHKVYDSIPGLANISINIYPIKDRFFVVVVRVAPSEELLGIEKDVCIYRYQNSRIEVLNALEIQSLITLRISSRFSERINAELDGIHKKTTAIDTYIKSLPILNSFLNNSVFLNSVLSGVNVVEPTHLTQQQFASLKDSYEKHANGLARGNILFFEDEQKPRLAEAYLRITVPRFWVKGLTVGGKEPALYFIPGGAIFYSENALNCSYNAKEPVLKVTVIKDYSIKFLCAYLKSSFYLWYITNQFNSMDIIPPSAFNCVRVPQLYPNKPEHKGIVQEIEKIFDVIVSAEKEFMVEQNKIKDSDKYRDFIIAHNNTVKEMFVQIDELIYSILNLTVSEVQTIKENLRVNGIFVPESVQGGL